MGATGGLPASASAESSHVGSLPESPTTLPFTPNHPLAPAASRSEAKPTVAATPGSRGLSWPTSSVAQGSRAGRVSTPKRGLSSVACSNGPPASLKPAYPVLTVVHPIHLAVRSANPPARRSRRPSPHPLSPDPFPLAPSPRRRNKRQYHLISKHRIASPQPPAPPALSRTPEIPSFLAGNCPNLWYKPPVRYGRTNAPGPAKCQAASLFDN